MNMEIFKRPLSSLKNERGFTLIELLTVVAIIAIIGGGMIAAFDGLEDRAAAGTSTGTIASLEGTVRTFAAVDKKLPNNMESLLAATAVVVGAGFSGTTGDDCSDLVAASLTNPAPDLPKLDPTPATFAKAKMLSSELTALVVPGVVTDKIVKSLVLAGITKVRYLDLAAEGPLAPTAASKIPAADCSAVTISGAVADIQNSMHAFEAPKPGDHNLGRGWNMSLAGTSGSARTDLAGTPKLELAFWAVDPNLTPECGYNCVKVGAKSTDTLVVMGIGTSSTLVGNGSFVSIAHAPYYSKVQNHEYPHYAMLIWVDNTSVIGDVKPARLVAIIDSRGDFLEEEYEDATETAS